MAIFIRDSRSGPGTHYDTPEGEGLDMAPSSPQVGLKKVQFSGESTVTSDSTNSQIAQASTASDQPLEKEDVSQRNEVTKNGVAATNGVLVASPEKDGVLMPKDSTLDSDAIEKGLEDLSIMRTLTEDETDFYFGQCKCPSCKASRRQLELGDENYLFSQACLFIPGFRPS